MCMIGDANPARKSVPSPFLHQLLVLRANILGAADCPAPEQDRQRWWGRFQ